MQGRSRAAARYAKTLLQLADAQGRLDPVRADVARLAGWIAESDDLRRFLANKALSTQTRLRVMEQVGAGRLNATTQRFLRFVEAKRRLEQLPQICARFLALYDLKQGIVKARITAPFRPEAQEVETIAAWMQARVKGALDLSVATDAALLGGFMARVGDVVYDLSVAGQLRRVKRALLGVPAGEGAQA